MLVLLVAVVLMVVVVGGRRGSGQPLLTVWRCSISTVYNASIDFALNMYA